MTYLTAARGFKAGGFNGRAGTAAAMATPFQVEQVWTHEAGLKSGFVNRSLRIDATYQCNDFPDRQILSFVGNTTATLLGNAGSAVVHGVEAEATGLLGRGFTAFATLGSMNDRYADLDAKSQPARLNSTDVSSTPDLMWSLGFDWTRSLGTYGAISLAADVIHQHDYQRGVSPAPRLRVPEVDLVNAFVTWTSPSEQWQLRLNGMNLSDERYQETGVPIGATAAVFPAKPREWRLSARYAF